MLYTVCFWGKVTQIFGNKGLRFKLHSLESRPRYTLLKFSFYPFTLLAMTPLTVKRCLLSRRENNTAIY